MPTTETIKNEMVSIFREIAGTCTKCGGHLVGGYLEMWGSSVWADKCEGCGHVEFE